MKAILLQRGHSHASCCKAIALAAKALLKKIPEDPMQINSLQLTKDELELINRVIAKFGAKDVREQPDSDK